MAECECESNGVFCIFILLDGKICLDVLRMPPGGSYNPAITLESILLSIQLLLASPNPDDPLRDDVSDEYRYNRELYNQNARKLSGSDESKAGNSSKRMKIDDGDADANSKSKNAVALLNNEHNEHNDEDDIESDSEQQQQQQKSNPSELDESGSVATERVSVSSKSNRKRKHNET